MTHGLPACRVRLLSVPPDAGPDVHASLWQEAPTLNIDQFRPESSDHRPVTRLRILADSDALHLLFTVQDAWVVCRHTTPGAPVCQDSCVEAFIQPPGHSSYLNVECNCGGILQASQVIDPTRKPHQPPADFRPLPTALLATVRTVPSLTGPIVPELTGPVDWSVLISIPLHVFATVFGTQVPLAASVWRANFYKCADRSSHPHWASWSPLDSCNFHLPHSFGSLTFYS